MTQSPVVASVALDVPIHHPFSYLIPEDIRDRIRLGSRVRVPFGPRKEVGFVVGLEASADSNKLKPIQSLIDDEPLLGENSLVLAQQIASRWFCGPGEALRAFLPGGVQRGAGRKKTAVVYPRRDLAEAALGDWPKGARTEKQRELLELSLQHPKGLPRQTLLRLGQSSDSPLKTLAKKELVEIRMEYPPDGVFDRLDLAPSNAPALEPAQRRCVEALCQALDRRTHEGFLLFGVTGSGKTEVFLAAIGHALEQGRGAIVMVPEISLTPQTVERFESRFGTCAVLHSHLTDAERARQWEELRRGRKRIAIGPRSAVFAPVKKLGLIILDEEHEGTFKQQNVPRYHARDVAMMRAKLEDAVVCLGSATPSLETWQASEAGEIKRLEMPERISRTPLPAVTRLDLRQTKVTGPGGVFSPLLVSLVRENLDRGEQTLLFLNRRGFRTAIKCRRCGETKVCRDCDVPMTYYKTQERLLCHHCGHSEPPPDRCPSCGDLSIHFRGFGTELIESAARSFFPGARIARMDAESMRKRHAHEEIFARMKSGEIDLLIGTQMVAKGLDFPGITLIGVVSGDSSLLLPDFRAAERTFQLMTQVAGRAGRGAKPGRVVIQSWTPDHYSFEAASRHDFPGFAEVELQHRRQMQYPPFGHLTRIVVQGEEEKKVLEKSQALADELRSRADEFVSLIGPAPAPISFLRGLHRHHLVLRAEKATSIESLLQASRDRLRSDRKLQILVDCDPTSMM